MQQSNRLRPFFENITFDRVDNEMILNFGPQHPSAHGQLTSYASYAARADYQSPSGYRISSPRYGEDGGEHDLQ